MNVNVVPIVPSQLDQIARRIQDGHDRTIRGGQEWVEGSLQVAAALLEGREALPANIHFGRWLKEQGLDFYNKNDRGALLGLASDLAVARTVLIENEDTRCYQNIWRANKRRFPVYRKTAHASGKRRAAPNPSRAMNFRRMKLGDDLIDKIKGTTLDRADEMRELVMLNRGAPEGEHTDIVKRLVADAIAGKAVSALAATAGLGTINRKRPDLIAAWRKRMVAAWKMATKEERSAFVAWLTEQED